jgi:hypothetical protein
MGLRTLHFAARRRDTALSFETAGGPIFHNERGRVKPAHARIGAAQAWSDPRLEACGKKPMPWSLLQNEAHVGALAASPVF